MAGKGEKQKQGWEKASSLDLDLKGMGIRLVGGGEEGKKAAPTWGTQRCEKRSTGRLRKDSPNTGTRV